jgi:hypothetical protein
LEIAKKQHEINGSQAPIASFFFYAEFDNKAYKTRF